MKKRTCVVSLFVAMAALMVSSCAREDRFTPVYIGQEIHTVFNISISKNTKTRTKTKTKSDADSKTTYDAEKVHAVIAADIAFGLVGIDKDLEILVDNHPVYEKNGLRTTDIIADTPDSTMSVSAYYPHVKNVSYHKDGSYAVCFTPDDVKKGPLVTNAVNMRCHQDFEAVSLRFHHIANSIGFKVCDITEDEQLKGLMHIRKVVLHGMPTEGTYVVDGENSHWVPNAKHYDIVVYEGNDFVSYGEENASFIAADRLSDLSDDCKRTFIVPEELKEGKHYVEIVFDVDGFDYDGTHYRGVTGKSQKIPLAGIIPDDMFELGLQYTFVLGMNLGTVYRPIEFSATTEEWEVRFNGRILDYDNE